MFSCSSNYLTHEQELYYRNLDIMRREPEGDTPGGSILDSSLIFQSKLKKYSVKSIVCGEFTQFYFYKTKRIISDKNLEKNISRKKEIEKYETKYKIKQIFDEDDLYKKDEKRVGQSLKEIELRNINRSKFELQRLVKSNIHDFKTFITLTFDQQKSDININDITLANKKFNIFRTYIRQLTNDFKYICVQEFQKRGAVHYHLLTNLDYTTCGLFLQEKKLWNKSSKSWQVGKPIKGWSYGYSLAKPLDDINVIGYISKYMTKDIDNRLFEKRRYHYSRNLKKPSEYYFDYDNKLDFLHFLKHICEKELVYKQEYVDKFGDIVEFYEYRTC